MLMNEKKMIVLVAFGEVAFAVVAVVVPVNVVVVGGVT